MADGVEVGRAHVIIVADGKPAVRQVQADFDKGMPQTGRKAGGHLGGGILAAASKFAGPLAALFAADKIAGGIFDAVGSASDLNETVSKASVIFGKNTAVIDAWASNADTKLGLTKNQAEGAAASLGDMFSQIGFTSADATKASQGVVQLAADLGSFNNLGTDDVLDRITAGFRGEYDSLQAIIPNINAARVEQEALRLTGVKSAKDLTAQQKAQAVMNILHKDGARALGDFARTQGGAANQQKIAAAQAGNLAAKFGALLLPILIKLLGFTNRVVLPGLTSLVTFLSANVGPAFARVQAFVAPFVAGLRRLVGEGTPATGFLSKQMVPALSGVAVAGRRLAAVVLPIIRQIAAAFLAKWPIIRPLVAQIFGSIRSTVVDVMAIVRKVISSVTTIVTLIWSRWGKQISAFTTGTFTTILRIIGGLLRIVQGVVNTVLGLITGNWRQAGEGIKLIMRGLATVVVNIVKNLPLVRIVRALLGEVRTAFSRGVDAIGQAWDRLKEKAKTPIRFVVNTVINNGLIAAFNKIARIIPGVGELPNVSVGFDRGGIAKTSRFGGILPGQSSWRGGDTMIAGVRPGEGWYVSEAMRDPYERARLFAVNKAAMAGQSLAKFRDIVGGFATGGLVGGSGRFSDLFASRLLTAQKLLGLQFSIFQRGFRPATSYSGTSHAGDAVDLGPVTARVVQVLRSLAIAAWRRGPAQGFSLRHIHGVPLPGAGFAAGSGAWQAQDYLRGGDGLGGRDYEARGGTLAKIGAFIKAGFSSFADWFKNLIGGPLGKLREIAASPLGRLAAGIPPMIVEGLKDKLKGYAGGTSYAAPGWATVGEHGAELVTGRSVRYFDGGERVFNARQTAGALGGIHIGTVQGYTADEVAVKIERERKHREALNPVFA